MGFRSLTFLPQLRVARFPGGRNSNHVCSCSSNSSNTSSRGSTKKLLGPPTPLPTRFSAATGLQPHHLSSQAATPAAAKRALYSQEAAAAAAAAAATAAAKRALTAAAARALYTGAAAATAAALQRAPPPRVKTTDAVPVIAAVPPRLGGAASCPTRAAEQNTAARPACAAAPGDETRVLRAAGEGGSSASREMSVNGDGPAKRKRKTAAASERDKYLAAKVAAATATEPAAAAEPAAGGGCGRAQSCNAAKAAFCCTWYTPWLSSRYRLAGSSSYSSGTADCCFRDLSAASDRRCLSVSCDSVRSKTRRSPQQLLVGGVVAADCIAAAATSAAAAVGAPARRPLCTLAAPTSHQRHLQVMFHQRASQRQQQQQQEPQRPWQHLERQQHQRRTSRPCCAADVAATGQHASLPAALPCSRRHATRNSKSSRSARAAAPAGLFCRQHFSTLPLKQQQQRLDSSRALPSFETCMKSRLPAAQFHTYGASQFSPHSPFSAPRHATTILCVRKGSQVCMAGDGMVSQGQMIVKPNARKIRRLQEGVVCGFAGATADCFTLVEKLESKLDEYPGQLLRACVELAKQWRTDRYLRHLEAVLIVADKKMSLEVSGVGDVLESHDGILGVGSGGPYAVAAARALFDVDNLSAHDICKRSMTIAASMCCHTNDQVVFELLENEAQKRPPLAADSPIEDKPQVTKTESSEDKEKK